MNATTATLDNKATPLAEISPAEMSTPYAAADFSHMTLPGWT